MPETAVAMVPPANIIVTGVVMAVRADGNLFCGCDSPWSGRVGTPANGKRVSQLLFGQKTKMKAENRKVFCEIKKLL